MLKSENRRRRAAPGIKHFLRPPAERVPYIIICRPWGYREYCGKVCEEKKVGFSINLI